MMDTREVAMCMKHDDHPFKLGALLEGPWETSSWGVKFNRPEIVLFGGRRLNCENMEIFAGCDVGCSSKNNCVIMGIMALIHPKL